MSKEANLERFSCQIRAYRDILANQLNQDKYAVVIPFDTKEDCLSFCRITNLTIAGIDDKVEAVAPIGTIGEESILSSYKVLAEKVLEEKKDEHSEA